MALTDHEWLACCDIKIMLDAARGKFTERKVRLLNCACCRRIWNLFTDDRSRKAVEIAEQFAEGTATLAELRNVADDAFAAYRQVSAVAVNTDSATEARYNAAAAAYNAAHHANFVSTTSRPFPDSVLPAARAAAAAGSSFPAVNAADPDIENIIENQTAPGTPWSRTMADEQVHLCGLIRDILGNSFRPVAVDPSWLAWNGGTVVKIAQSIYDQRAFDRLPVLADILEDAGCHHADILDHCRQPGPHVRGCHVIDSLLGKS